MAAQVKADLMLVFVALAWGGSYILIDICLEDMGSFNLNTLRFLGAFLIAAAVSFPRLRTVNRETLKYSAILGALLVAVNGFVNFGVLYTSLSNAGFLCCLSVIFTPIIIFFMGKKQGVKLWVVVAMAAVGIALLTLNESFRPALGDILCIGCALTYATVLLITEHAVRKDNVDAYHLGVFQLGFAGAFNLLLSLILEDFHLPGSGKVWASALFLAVVCTGVAYIIQVLAQQYTSATHVGVIFCLEPVFAGLVAYFLANEVLLPRAYVGAVILILSIFIMELDLGKLFRRPGDPAIAETEPPKEVPPK